jgi:hypothetical protein
MRYRRINMNIGGTNLEKDEVVDRFYISVVPVLVQKQFFVTRIGK